MSEKWSNDQVISEHWYVQYSTMGVFGSLVIALLRSIKSINTREILYQENMKKFFFKFAYTKTK
jgi:hypothetical protein